MTIENAIIGFGVWLGISFLAAVWFGRRIKKHNEVKVTPLRIPMFDRGEFRPGPAGNQVREVCPTCGTSTIVVTWPVSESSAILAWCPQCGDPYVKQGAIV